MKGHRKPDLCALDGALDRPPTGTNVAVTRGVVRIRECDAIIQKQGLTYVSPTGASRRPVSTLIEESIEAARRLAAETPARHLMPAPVR